MAHLSKDVVMVCIQRQLLCFPILALDHCCLVVSAPFLIFEVHIYAAWRALHKPKYVFLQ